jgi:hypothetical protein
MTRLLIALLLTSCGSPSNGIADTALREQINAQVAKANTIAQKHGYQPVPAPIVELMQRDARCQNPAAFMVEQEVTANTNYDNDPNYDYDDRLGHIRICAGGRFIEPNRIQVTREAIDAGYGVWYECEHYVLYLRDRDRYYATMYHTPETSHPILGE